MYFENCANPHLGATILLRGGSQNELRKVKNVASMMIFAVYSCRLEKSFLMDEFAKPPSSIDSSFQEESSRNSSPSKNKKFNDDNQLINVENTKDNSSNTSRETEVTTTLLMDANNSYDTLKLFKSKSKSVSDESKNTEENILTTASYEHDEKLKKFNEDRVEKSKSASCIGKDKSELEKRSVHGEFVSDKSDPLHQYLNKDEDDVFVDTLSPNGQCLSVADLPLLNKFKKALDGTILSVSPYLKFSIPYLETEPGKNCVLRNFFPKELYYSTLMSTTLEGMKKKNNYPVKFFITIFLLKKYLYFYIKELNQIVVVTTTQWPNLPKSIIN